MTSPVAEKMARPPPGLCLSVCGHRTNLDDALKACTGRGPTKSWTTIDNGLVTVVLRDTLTKGERSLVADGRAQLVLDMRHAYQHTMGDELVAGVEQVTARNVIAFLSANHIDPDIAIESFVLEPIAQDKAA